MAQGGSSTGVRILVFVGILGLVNLLSYLLHWGFWVY